MYINSSVGSNPTQPTRIIFHGSYRMPFHLELGSHGQPFPQGKAIVVNTQSGKHYSNSPIPLVKAKAQMRVLESVSEKYDGLRKIKESK